ncbi:MAG: NTP transferase domain-containing protein, partial [Eggerthellaceae bacterium]|nr:NTP transferase domain-containing protein [Eggerthellaceae bacterium]
MVLNLYQFEVLRASTRPKKPTQREIAVNAGISLGSVNKAFREMREAGCIDANGAITKKGTNALAPYKVENAVILAAGMATRFAPLSFEQPKAMFEVRGEILIERVIRQLKEAGIDDIVVVVGYMKERFFYLEDQFGVRIVVNPEYAVRNNHSSIRCVAGMLGNTYIISSDQYYTRNIFEPYCYCACCSASFSDGPTAEQTLLLDDKNTVLGLEQGGSDAYYMQG